MEIVIVLAPLRKHGPDQPYTEDRTLSKAWVETRQPDMANMLERLVFIDETSLKTNLVKTTGWAPAGQRLIDHTPLATGTPRPSSRAALMTG